MRNKTSQYLVSIIAVALVALLGYFLQSLIGGYRSVALLLLMTVSVLAMIYEIKPVLLAACLSALIWDFFFIPPRLTFTVSSAEDFLLLLMYFIIVLLNAVLTFKLRQIDNEKRQKEEREKTIALYNTLLNSLSHELRTPISTIIAATDTLYDEKSKITEQNKKALIDEISKASLRLDRQVANLLNMSRLQSATLQLKKDWCDISEFIFTIINKLEKKESSHKLIVTVNSELPLVKIDSGLIEQVVLNILSNAIFYTPEGTDIEITATVEQELAEERSTGLATVYHLLVIKIADNGPGFPEEEIPKVFEQFYRLPNSKTGGTGLGLSIAKGFIEAHNGTIGLTNREKGGAIFSIVIPVEISGLNKLKHD